MTINISGGSMKKRTAIAALVLGLVGALVAPSPAAHAAIGNHWHGWSIRAFPTKAAGRWIGQYSVGSKVMQRIDPAAAPPSGHLSAAKWTGAVAKTPARVHRAAWVLSHYAGRKNPSGPAATNVQAAAVDAAVLHLLRGGAWRIDGTKGAKRIRQARYSSVVRDWATQFVKEAIRYAGPYRIAVGRNAPTTGGTAVVTVHVRSAKGAVMAGVPVSISYAGKAGKWGKTDSKGAVSFTWSDVTGPGLHAVTVTAHHMATTKLLVRKPRHGSRLAAARQHENVRRTVQAVVKAIPHLWVTPQYTVVAVGSSWHPYLHVGGALGNTTAQVTGQLFGPFTSPSAISCTGTPVTTRSANVTGNRTAVTSSTSLSRVAWYAWQVSRPADAWNAAVTQCVSWIASGTQASAKIKALSSTVTVGHLAQAAITLSNTTDYVTHVTAVLYGPYRYASRINCGSNKALHTYKVGVNGNGQYLTPRPKITARGWYAYRVFAPDAGLTNGHNSSCASSAAHFQGN